MASTDTDTRREVGPRTRRRSLTSTWRPCTIFTTPRPIRSLRPRLASTDAATGGDGSGVQDTPIPACVRIAACLLFTHRARLRLRPQKLHFLRVCHSPKIYYHGLRLSPQPYLYECTAPVPTAGVIGFAKLAMGSFLTVGAYCRSPCNLFSSLEQGCVG